MRTMPIPFLLEDTIEAIGRNQQSAAAQRRARETKIKLDPITVAEHFPAIEQHKWFLSERLGRDVGTKVAAVDYFENVRPETQAKSFGESLKSALNHLRLSVERLMEFDGPNSILNLERMARGTNQSH